MSDEKVAGIHLRTTAECWEHIASLIRRNDDPYWVDFNEALLRIIEHATDSTSMHEMTTHEPDIETDVLEPVVEIPF